MTDLMMLEHLLMKTGRLYDKVEENNKIIIQVHCFNERFEFDFDADENLEEEWENPNMTTWLSGGAYHD